jgi:Spy/CpxP family protein refolding chaperone
MKKSLKIAIAAAVVIAALVSAGVDAQAQGWRGGAGRGPGGGAATGIVPGVQLTPEQEKQVAEIRSETMKQVQQIRWDSALTPEEKAAEIERVRQEGHERVMSVLTPEQRQQFETRWPGCRFYGGRWGQGAGPLPGYGAGRGRGARPGGYGGGYYGGGYGMAGLVPGVQLTQEQQERIRQIRADGAREASAIMGDPKLPAQEKTRRVQQIRERTHERVMGVLTPEQQRQFGQRAGAWRTPQAR